MNMVQTGAAKALASEAETPKLETPETGKTDHELPQAPEVKELTGGTREKALRLVENAEGAERAEASRTPEDVKATGAALKAQAETHDAAAQAAGLEQGPTETVVQPPAPTQPVETTKPRGFFGKLIDGLKSFWRVITFRKPKKEA